MVSEISQENLIAIWFSSRLTCIFFMLSDGGAYNTKSCNYDYEDCLECNSQVPNLGKIGKSDHSVRLCILSNDFYT